MANSAYNGNENCLTSRPSSIVTYSATHFITEKKTTTYRLNASNAIRGAYGMLHFDTADWNGQKPVVRTRTNRSTPFRLACSKINNHLFINWHCHHAWKVMKGNTRTLCNIQLEAAVMQ